MDVHDIAIVAGWLRGAGLEESVALACATKLSSENKATLGDLRRIAGQPADLGLKKYLDKDSDVKKVQSRALLLGRTDWAGRTAAILSSAANVVKGESKSVDEADAKIKSEVDARHRVVFDYLVSLGVSSKESSASTKKLHEEGYTTVKDIKELSKNKDRLMRFFNKLGTVDRLHRSSSTNELEEMALSEVVDFTGEEQHVLWDDIAGLDFAKNTLREATVLPRIIPHIFNTLLRAPPLGVLLFGPPGTGKTLLAKAVGTSVRGSATFFSISAASINSKWFGESEKVVRSLFVTARKQDQSIIFIDEIDSLLSSRGRGMENDASRKVKTEFMVQLSGINHQVGRIGQLLVIAATNRPWDLDSAVIRRLAKRIYVPLPKEQARAALLRTSLLGDVVPSDDNEKKVNNNDQGHPALAVTEREIGMLANATSGYSGSDLFELCREASTIRLRSLDLFYCDPTKITIDMVRPIQMNDFNQALDIIRPSVAPETLDMYAQWNRMFGSDPKTALLEELNQDLSAEKERLVELANAAVNSMGSGGHGVMASASQGPTPDSGVMTKVATVLRSWYGGNNRGGDAKL